MWDGCGRSAGRRCAADVGNAWATRIMGERGCGLCGEDSNPDLNLFVASHEVLSP